MLCTWVYSDGLALFCFSVIGWVLLSGVLAEVTMEQLSQNSQAEKEGEEV